MLIYLSLCRVNTSRLGNEQARAKTGNSLPIARILQRRTSRSSGRLDQSGEASNQSHHDHGTSEVPTDINRADAHCSPFQRLIPMTCQQARHILASVTIHNDRLEALQYVKRFYDTRCLASFSTDFSRLHRRALNDAHTQEGTDYILSVFPFYDDKLKAGSLKLLPCFHSSSRSSRCHLRNGKREHGTLIGRDSSPCATRSLREKEYEWQPAAISATAPLAHPLLVLHR